MANSACACVCVVCVPFLYVTGRLDKPQHRAELHKVFLCCCCPHNFCDYRNDKDVPKIQSNIIGVAMTPAQFIHASAQAWQGRGL